MLYSTPTWWSRNAMRQSRYLWTQVSAALAPQDTVGSSWAACLQYRECNPVRAVCRGPCLASYDVPGTLLGQSDSHFL